MIGVGCFNIIGVRVPVEFRALTVVSKYIPNEMIMTDYCAKYFVSYATYIYIIVIQTLLQFLLAVTNHYEFGTPRIRE
jgi:hypothetical protein